MNTTNIVLAAVAVAAVGGVVYMATRPPPPPPPPPPAVVTSGRPSHGGSVTDWLNAARDVVDMGVTIYGAASGSGSK